MKQLKWRRLCLTAATLNLLLIPLGTIFGGAALYVLMSKDVRGMFQNQIPGALREV